MEMFVRKFIYQVTAFVTILLATSPKYSAAIKWTTEPATNEPTWNHSRLPKAVTNWARILGDEIIKSSEVMRHKEAKESYQNVKMVHINGDVLLHQKANEVRELLRRRKDAVVRIRERAESMSNLSFPIEKEYPQPYDAVKNIDLSDTADVAPEAKHAPPMRSDSIEKWAQTESAQFTGWVNTTVSGVHVPSDVYDGSIPNLTEPIIQHGIRYSKEIEPVFLKNFEEDRETSYQYFAHVKGFLRMFPAVEMGTESDYYDARFRPWFSKAATSNKNVVILLDYSGSMRGQNMLIARHVINNILDTLSPDDFVNIILFGQKSVRATIKCFEDKLVPATFLNIVELKRSLVKIKPICPSNLESGLKYAFTLLDQTREKKIGAMCNQAIMVVTDGPWMDTSIFGRHNEPFGAANKPVRVFTYQVGEFLRDAPGLKWIACQNQGWYLNVTLEEAARDRVAKYIPVMARPWVMNNSHLIHWTHAYFHKMDTISVDLGWKQHERDKQKRRVLKYLACRQTPEILSLGNEDKPRFLQEHAARKEYNVTEAMNLPYLVVTVSTPVYNKSINLTTNPYGELLGVAGIDVPIEEIRRVVPPHKAGVNNYFFMVTNNGFVLFHPELRSTSFYLSLQNFSAIGNLMDRDVPLLDKETGPEPIATLSPRYTLAEFFDTPKPTYASVDMSDLEIELSSRSGKLGTIEQLRKQVVNRKDGTLLVMAEQPFDDMNRVETVRRRYYFTAIKETPYSLVFAVDDIIGPWNHTFRSRREDRSRLTEYLKGYWRTHPSWYYCRHNHTAVPVPDSELLMAMQYWIWDGKVLCDEELIDSLIEDASLTSWFPCYDQKKIIVNRTRLERISQRESEQKGRRLLEPFVTFIATKSGLTRWVDTDSAKPSVPFERHFSVLHPRGPEEVWYRRAALHPELTIVTSGPVLPTFSDDVNLEYEWQEIDPDDMIITVSKAVVIDGHKPYRNIPAVVGMQFKQKTLQGVVNDTTESEWCDGDSSCVPACRSPDLMCYLLDADSIVIASSIENRTGFPFGKWHPEIMEGMIKDGIFRVVRIRDNQAICLNSSSRPLFLPKETWTSTSIALTAMSIATRFLPTSNSYPRILSIAAGVSLGSLAFATPTTNTIGLKKRRKEEMKAYWKAMRIPKSQPYSCTRQIDAMQLRLRPPPRSHSAFRHDTATKCPDRPYSVAYVPKTNLLFVAVINCTLSSKSEEYASGPVNFNLSRIEINRDNIDNFLHCKMADVDLTRHRTRFHSCLSNHTKEALNETECGLDHKVQIDAVPPEPPMFQFEYNYKCLKEDEAEEF